MAFGAQIRNDLAILVQVHIGSRCQWRLFAEVEKGLAPVGQLDGHEAAATEVAGCGVNHCQRVTDCNSGIDRVAAILEHIDTHMGGQMLGSHDHAVFRSNRGL